jgi:hypothetical protein
MAQRYGNRFRERNWNHVDTPPTQSITIEQRVKEAIKKRYIGRTYAGGINTAIIEIIGCDDSFVYVNNKKQDRIFLYVSERGEEQYFHKLRDKIKNEIHNYYNCGDIVRFITKEENFKMIPVKKMKHEYCQWVLSNVKEWAEKCGDSIQLNILTPYHLVIKRKTANKNTWVELHPASEMWRIRTNNIYTSGHYYDAVDFLTHTFELSP